MNEEILLSKLQDLDADLAYLLDAITGARIESEVRPIAERVRTSASMLAEILRDGSCYEEVPVFRTGG